MCFGVISSAILFLVFLVLFRDFVILFSVLACVKCFVHISHRIRGIYYLSYNITA